MKWLSKLSRSQLKGNKRIQWLLLMIVLLPFAYFILAPGIVNTIDPPPDEDGDDTGGSTTPSVPDDAKVSVSLSKYTYYSSDSIIVSMSATSAGSTSLKLDNNILVLKDSDYANFEFIINKASLAVGTHNVLLTGTSPTGTGLSDSVSFMYTGSPEPTTPEPVSLTITSPVNGAAYAEGSSLRLLYSVSGYSGTPTVKINDKTLTDYISGTTLMASTLMVDGLKVGTNKLTITLGTTLSKSLNFEIIPPDGTVDVDISEPQGGKVYDVGNLPTTINIKWSIVSKVYDIEKVYISFSTDTSELENYLLAIDSTSYQWTVPSSLKSNFKGAIDIKVKVIDTYGFSGAALSTIYFDERDDFPIPAFDIVSVILSFLVIVYVIKKEDKDLVISSE